MICCSGIKAAASSLSSAVRRCSASPTSHSEAVDRIDKSMTNTVVTTEGARPEEAGKVVDAESQPVVTVDKVMTNSVAASNLVCTEGADHVAAGKVVDMTEGQDGESFTIVITNLSGKIVQLKGLTSRCKISQLCQHVALEFGYRAGKCWHQPHEISQLCDGTRPLDNMAITLDEAGLCSDSTLTFIWTADLVTLQFADGETLDVERNLACSCERLKEAMTENGDNLQPLPHDIKVSILKKVLEYCAYHMNVPVSEIQKPLRSTDLRECGASDWDADYVDIPQELLFELVLAANSLNIKSLLDLLCAKVASMIKGKTTEEIRKQFNIVNDFTPEEEARVREENRWCEDA
mmetsp:Transcript_106585/g.200755  ORF Transcript_106585/g.200755 Transcript_106585/m.200755 type:complete len:349 (-) Transcript_106585:109-1155(-)